MKRVLTAVMAIATVGVLAACGSGKAPGGEASAGGQLTMGFSQVGAESGWRTANTTSIKDAAKAADVDLKFSDANGEQEKQISAIRSFVQQRVKVIAFSPVGAHRLGRRPARGQERRHPRHPHRPRGRHPGEGRLQDVPRRGLHPGRQMGGRVGGEAVRAALDRSTSSNSKAPPGPTPPLNAARASPTPSRRTPT